MFHRLLIANRGEIAVRIIHACRDMGIQPIAIYSDADRRSLHVRLAREAINIGPAPAAESYLNQETILAAARSCGADAIHPGYGFLSENAGFAGRCRAAGLAFVGPPTEAIRRMGDKADAKRLARSAGIPVLDGYEGADQSDARLTAEAGRIGYPLLIKPALGGGGKGMLAVEDASALAQARREAQAAFGNGGLILERLLFRPRHVEVQVLGDRHGRLVALGERDCSTQRRHQKVIEETPSPAVRGETRRRLSELGLRFAAALDYDNAGTVEFLLDEDGSVYFLEMNTRLQVEHAVTEAVYGLDLVRLQIEMASGLHLRLPRTLTRRGHAIECRVYAEDPGAGFLPSTGRILAFRAPEGPGVRNDLGTFAGDEIGPYYDPLLAKLTVWGEDRVAALRRMRRALGDYVILGVRTNLAVLQNTIETEEFASGEVDTGFLERERDRLTQSSPPPAAVFCAASAGLLSGTSQTTNEVDVWRRLGPWRTGGQDLRFHWLLEGSQYEVRASREIGGGNSWRLQSEGSDYRCDVRDGSAGSILLESGGELESCDVASDGTHTWVGIRGRAWMIQPAAALSLKSVGVVSSASGSRGLDAPMPGLIAQINVRDGDRVAPHEVLLILEAMKMEHGIEAPTAGVVRKVYYAEGDLVPGGARLVDLDSSP